LPVPPLELQNQFTLRCADLSGLGVQQSAAPTKDKAIFYVLLANVFEK